MEFEVIGMISGGIAVGSWKISHATEKSIRPIRGLC